MTATRKLPEATRKAWRFYQAFRTDDAGRATALRKVLGAQRAEHEPPLQPEDVVGFGVMHLARSVLPHLVSRGKPLRAGEWILSHQLGLLCVLRAYPELCVESGFCPGAGLELPAHAVLERYGEHFDHWVGHVLDPALARAGDADFQLDEETRDGRLLHIWFDIVHHVGPQKDWNQIPRAAAAALAAVGLVDPDWPRDSSGRPVLPAGTGPDWLTWTRDLAADDPELLFLGDDGMLRLGQRQATKVYRKSDLKMEKPRDRDHVLPAVGGEHGEPQQDPPDTREPEQDAILSALEARDLRDRLDCHPPLREVAEAVGALRDAELAGRAVSELRLLLDDLELVRDRALQAAMIYEWYRGEGARGSWSRGRLAELYRVEPHQLEYRQEEARGRLRALGVGIA